MRAVLCIIVCIIVVSVALCSATPADGDALARATAANDALACESALLTATSSKAITKYLQAVFYNDDGEWPFRVTLKLTLLASTNTANETPSVHTVVFGSRSFWLALSDADVAAASVLSLGLFARPTASMNLTIKLPECIPLDADAPLAATRALLEAIRLLRHPSGAMTPSAVKIDGVEHCRKPVDGGQVLFSSACSFATTTYVWIISGVIALSLWGGGVWYFEGIMRWALVNMELRMGSRTTSTHYNNAGQIIAWFLLVFGPLMLTPPLALSNALWLFIVVGGLMASVAALFICMPCCCIVEPDGSTEAYFEEFRLPWFLDSRKNLGVVAARVVFMAPLAAFYGLGLPWAAIMAVTSPVWITYVLLVSVLLSTTLARLVHRVAVASRGVFVVEQLIKSAYWHVYGMDLSAANLQSIRWRFNEVHSKNAWARRALTVRNDFELAHSLSTPRPTPESSPRAPSRTRATTTAVDGLLYMVFPFETPGLYESSPHRLSRQLESFCTRMASSTCKAAIVAAFPKAEREWNVGTLKLAGQALVIVVVASARGFLTDGISFGDHATELTLLIGALALLTQAWGKKSIVP